METQLDMEKNKVEQEKKKLVLAHDQISQLVRMRHSLSHPYQTQESKCRLRPLDQTQEIGMSV